VIICRNCGHENAEDPQFCTNCGAFLPWDATGREDTRTGNERGAGLTATLVGEHGTVAPGGEIEVEVQVRNTGRVVDQFTVQPLGQPADWAEVDPAALQLMPNQEGAVRIRIRPPRSAEVQAGLIPFSVQVTSRADPATMVRIESSLELEPFGDIEVELVPRTSEGRRAGEHKLVVSNGRSQPVEVRLEVGDPDQRLRIAVRPQRVQLGLGAWVPARVVVRPRRLHLFGQPVTHPFQAAVTRVDPAGQQDAAPITVDGSMLQRALLPAWMIPVAAAMLTILIGVVAFTVLRDDPPRKTGTVQPDTSGSVIPTTTPGSGPDDTGPGGNGTPPPTDTSGGSPTSGSQPDGPQKIPDLAGQLADPADQRLQAAGFSPQRVSRASNQVASGRVIGTDPEAGTEADKGASVKLIVSSGSTPLNDLLNSAPSASWSSGAGRLPFNGSESDERGFVKMREGRPLEDGSVEARVLETHPQWIRQGFIEGDFTLPAPIIPGDKFQTEVGFLAGEIVGEVDFTVLVVDDSGNARRAGSIQDSAVDKRRHRLEADLSPFAGARTLRLRVDAGSSSAQDWAVWIGPKVVGSSG
jgi:hypothetical protein